MNRRVFIIGAPLSYEVPTFVSGVKTDVKNYRNFFASPTGGAYYTSEIIHIENPTWARLKFILAANPAYSSTFVFSGHGSIGKHSQNTMLNINSYESVALIDVIKSMRSSRKLVITDSCRSYVEEPSYYNLGGPVVPEVMQIPSYLTHQQARNIFDTCMIDTEPGIQALYSCSEGEESTLRFDGSYYSKSLLKSVKAWSQKIENQSILLGVGAHNLSSKGIKNYQNNQNPKTYRTESGANFPFAIRYGAELLDNQPKENPLESFYRLL